MAWDTAGPRKETGHRPRTQGLRRVDSDGVEPADGKLGVLMVGLGAVSSTVIAGVEHIRRGSGEPVGSLTQMATIRLGRRTDSRAPFIKEFVPLAELDDLVFGAWTRSRTTRTRLR